MTFSGPVQCVVALSLLLALGGPVCAQELARWRGDPTPPLVLEDMQGKQIRLAELRGKTVLVNFWATWCVPCVDEMPSIQRLKAHLDPSRFAVIAVNVGESKARVEEFLGKVRVNFPIVFDPQSDTMHDWKVRGLPTSYVIGPDGKILFYQVGDLDWARDEVIRQIKGIR
jgi:thiol-disulfide isomerase/thioredoxin